MLSVIIPAYNEEANIENTAQVLGETLNPEGIAYELIFVDDGSRDKSWKCIEAVGELDPMVRGVRFSRNFGKEAAIFAGLAESEGDCCVVMDCDLQHPPRKVVEMYRLWEQGYQVIEGVKANRGRENAVHKVGARIFYNLMTKATHSDMSHASDFKLLDRKAVNAILNMPERNAFFRALSSWVGFRTTQVQFDVQARTAGQSKWSTGNLISYGITNIVAFSTVPMQIVTYSGVIVFIFAVILGIQSLIRYFCGQALEGFTTVILLILFIGSILMMSLGIIGFYIAKIYEEVKRRPRYIVAERKRVK